MNDLEKFCEGRMTARQVKLVKVLDCSESYPDGLPDEIRHFVNLEELDLGGNGFTQVPDSVWALTKLKRLYIDNNQLTEFPHQICDLTDLEELSITANYIASIPPEIKNLTKLKWITMAQNRLSTLPEEFAELPSLTQVGLSHNLFTTIPQSIPENVNMILLSNNSISLLHFPRCTIERKIELCENPLIIVSKDKPTLFGDRIVAVLEGKIRLDIDCNGELPLSTHLYTNIETCVWEKP